MMAEGKEREAKRRKESPDPRQRIEAKLKALGGDISLAVEAEAEA